MLISEVIKSLEEIKKEHGEIQVWESYEEEIDLYVNITETYKAGVKEKIIYVSVSGL